MTASEMGKKRMAAMTPDERREFARKGGFAKAAAWRKDHALQQVEVARHAARKTWKRTLKQAIEMRESQ